MHKISRYILKELFMPFFMSLGVILFLFILNVTMKMLPTFVGKGIDLMIIIELFYLSLGWILAMAVPMATLVAGLMGYGRLAQDNEFAALQSSGVSITKILLPGLVVGALLSYGMLVFNDKILPEMNHRNKILKQSIQRKKPLTLVEPGIFVKDLPGMIFKASKVDLQNNMLYKVVVLPDAADAKSRMTVTAEKGRLLYDMSTQRYVITLYDGEIASLDKQKPSGYTRSAYTKLIWTIEAQGVNFERSENSYYSEREKSIDSLKAQIERMKAANAEKSEINEIEVEYHKKYSLAFACFIMMLIGAPLGLMSGRGGIGASAFMSILIFTIYWFFLMSGEDLADKGSLSPFLAMWNANVLTGIIALFLIYKTGRGTKVSFEFVTALMYKIKKLFLKKTNR